MKQNPAAVRAQTDVSRVRTVVDSRRFIVRLKP